MFIAQYESPMEMSFKSIDVLHHFKHVPSRAPATMLLLKILWQSVLKFVTGLYTVNMYVLCDVFPAHQVGMLKTN